jgi:hypothetical protein
MKILIMQSLQFSCYFLPHMSEHLPQQRFQTPSAHVSFNVSTQATHSGFLSRAARNSSLLFLLHAVYKLDM